MKHRKDKFLLGVFLGILMVTMAVLSGCGAKAEPKPDPGSGKYLIYYLNSSLTKLPSKYRYNTCSSILQVLKDTFSFTAG